MERKQHVGNAFLDVALVGVIITTIGVVVGLVRGGGLDLTLVGAALLIYGAYFIGALRVGVSPMDYLRNVISRGSSPS